ncbi:MAG: hypothetical protein RRX92_06710 [Lachnospiraceae bacterium]
MKESLFRKKSIDKISSPEQLTDYMRVLRPSIWIVLLAAVILLVALLLASMYVAIPDSVELNGVSQNGTVVCYLDNVANITEDMAAEVSGTNGKVLHIDDKPLSKMEVEKRFSQDYIIYMLNVQDWNYEVTIAADDVPDGLVKVKMKGKPIKPIDFLMGKGAE